MNNENTLPEGSVPSGGISAPENGFSASICEVLCVIFSFPLAWIYIRPIGDYGLIIFFLGYAALTEALNWGRPRPLESWLLLACTALSVAGSAFGRGVWDGEQLFIITHGFAVWWAMSRSGCLSEGVSGHLLPIDALFGAIIYPFGGWFLRVRTLWWGMRGLRRRDKRAEPERIAVSVLAVIAAVGLFTLAFTQLIGADSGFRELTDGIAGMFDFEIDDEYLAYFVLSLPVGAYIYGLLAGTAREDLSRVRVRAERVNSWLGGLGRVPSAVWTGLAAVFALTYALFFAVQARYLFGAFFRMLPEGFIVSQYAREGFFELCRVMAINFALLWLLRRTASAKTAPIMTVTALLLAESALFAVTALSKLWLYIDCFGFTPLRLQSVWLVLVLLGGTAAWAVSYFAGKRCFRPWCLASAAALALLCVL